MNNHSDKILIVVPLRLASVRVPQKILADISGLSLARRTVGEVLKFSKKKKNVVVCAAVDDVITLGHLKETYPVLEVVLTKPELKSGTDRVNSAYEFLVNRKTLRGVKAVVNLQGDMPFFSPDILESAVSYFEKNPNFNGVWTAAHKFTSLDEIKSLACVKALRSKTGRAVYFSRYPIPYSRVEPDLHQSASLCHIGIYAYSPKALNDFCKSPPSTWELSESLEQLRALEMDMNFIIEEVPVPEGCNSYRGIDTPEDLDWARKFSQENKI